MDPFTILTIGKKLADITGLTDTVCDWFDGDNGPSVAKEVINIAEKTIGIDVQSIIDRGLSEEQKIELETAIMDRQTELKKLAYADRADARDMQKVALMQGDSSAKKFIYRFSWFWSISAVIFIFAVVFFPVPEANKGNVNFILGFLLGTIIAAIIGFFYGSSEANHDGKGTPAASYP